MISSNPRLPQIPHEGDDTVVTNGFMRRFYEHFYREWRHLAGLLIDRGKFVRNKAFTTAWTAPAGTAPAIGNGTLEAAYIMRDGLCKVWIRLVGGSTTAWGSSGSWRFTVPVNAARDSIGPVYILDSGTAIFVGMAFVQSGTNSVIVATNSGNVGFNSPMTWATNDTLNIDMEYLV